MDIYTIANWLTGFIEAYFLFVLCETFMERRECCKNYVYIAGVICAGILIDLSNSLFSITILNIVIMLLCEFLISFIYKGKLEMHVLCAVLSYMLAVITEVSILAFLSFIFNISASNIIADGYLRLLGIALSKVLCYAVIKYISFKFKREIKGYDLNYWTLFVIMFGVTALTMFAFCKILEESVSNYIRNLIIGCSCGLNIATVIVLFLYENALKQKSLLVKNQMSEFQLKEQVKHYNDIMMTQGQVKKLNHDLNNHLLSMKAIIEKKRYDECIQYIDSLLADISIGSSYIDTGNTVLDAIISSKKAEAEKNNIKFTSKIRIPSGLPISQEDECIIFGNALDNAIEATMKVPGEKYINLSLIFDKETLMCKISNPCIDNNNYITTKKDVKNHGIGKENIKKALEKYNSVSKVIYENNEYTLIIIIMALSIYE